jgi:hypothetical protein
MVWGLVVPQAVVCFLIRLQESVIDFQGQMVYLKQLKNLRCSFVPAIVEVDAVHGATLLLCAF